MDVHPLLSDGMPWYVIAIALKHKPYHPHVTNPNCTRRHQAMRLWPVAGAALLQRRRLIVGIGAPGFQRAKVGERTRKMTSSAWVKTK